MGQKFKPYDKYKDSETVWLDNIPSHWSIIRNGYLFKEVVDTGHPELELLSIMKDKGIIKQSETGRKTRASEDRSLYKKIKVGELGYNLMNAFMGSIGISKFEGILSPAYAVGKPLISMNPFYYHYLYRTPFYQKIFDSFSYGIMYERNRLYYERFKTIPAPYPTIDEQTQIVNFIRLKQKQIKKFIRNKQKLIKLLEEQKQAIINQAVTKGIDPDVKHKPSGIDWLGDIPEHWEVRRLRTIASVNSSGVDKHTIEGETPICLCNYVDVYKNDFITSEIDFMKASATKHEINKFKLKAEDVIITKDSEMWNDIAIPALVKEDFDNVICAYHLALIRPNNELLKGEFLFRAFCSQDIYYQFQVGANGVTRFGLPQYVIKGAIVPIPPIDEQTEIIKFISEKCCETEKVIQRAKKEIDLIKEYQTRLISDVVTGKIDVRDIPIPFDDEEVEDIEDLEDVVEELDETEDTVELEYA